MTRLSLEEIQNIPPLLLSPDDKNVRLALNNIVLRRFHSWL